MSGLVCYRCGAALDSLSLPWARRDECPRCRAELHVCRMCTHYAPRLSRGCDEDDAPDVRDKETANFCDYFRPRPDAFDAGRAAASAAARAELAKLFGDAGGDSASPIADAADAENASERALREAEALFKR
ncbi:MAG: hypothetical protein LOD94_15710 [Gammaproteobacteria bacterium]|nr:hypothetical protein [Gammaproteobacteria bacterium]